MSCIHYKFRNNSKHDTIQFDGSYITVGEIKQAILGQKKMGKAPDFTLQIINAQTQEAYNDDNQLIPRNADVTVKRIPTGNKVSKAQLAAQSQSLDMYKMSNTPLPLTVTMENDLSKTEGTEEDKLKAMMKQQAMAYVNPNNNNNNNKRYNKANADEEIPLNYICHRCNTPGHLIKNCPTNGNAMFEHLNRGPKRKMTLSLRKTEKSGPELTPDEKRLMEENQKTTQDKVKTLAQQAYTNIPQEMKCPICKQLMVDACLNACCGQSFCDECIRDKLLDDSVCPACGDEVSLNQLISNKALRVTINKYKKDHQDQIAKLYSDCHIQPKSRDSTPKPDPETSRPPTVGLLPDIKPAVSLTLIESTSNLALTDTKPVISMVTPSLPSSMLSMPPVSIAPPPVAIMDRVEPPPAVAILPLKEEIKEEPVSIAEMKEVKPVVSTILPPLSSFPTSVQAPLPLPPMNLLPFNPVPTPMHGAPMGLLPPPLPLPEPIRENSPKDRILDPSEFYTIQKELRRLQERRRSRSSSYSPTRRRHSKTPPERSRGPSADRHRRHREPLREQRAAEKRRQESHHRIRIERTARYSDRRGGPPTATGRSRVGRGAGREPRTLLERSVRNDRVRVPNGERRSNDSEDRRSDHSDRRSYEEVRRSDGEKEQPPSRDDSEPLLRFDSDPKVDTTERAMSPKLDGKHKKRRDKDHKKKKHKKKDKKDKKKKKDKPLAEPEIRPSLTEYSASDDSSEEDAPTRDSRSRSPSPFNPIIAPRQASPSPDRIPARPSPTPSPSPKRSPSKSSSPSPDIRSKSPARSPPLSPSPADVQMQSPPHTPKQETPKPLTPATTPTATGGETPQFTNGNSSEDDDAVSIDMNHSDMEVNGAESSSSNESGSENESTSNLEKLKEQYKKAEAQIKQMQEQRLADKKKLKKKKKKKRKKVKEDEDKKMKKKQKKRKQKEKDELEEGEIKTKSKKRKRSQSEIGSQESSDVEQRKKTKKGKHSKDKKDKSETSSKSKGVEIKVNFDSLKSMENGSKTISITSPAKTDSSRRVSIGVSPVKPMKVKSKLDNHRMENANQEVADSKSRRTKSHKKSRHKISKNAVSGIEDDPEGI
ncbi:uncharacterized protein LOC134817619 [Bolinopsis microptera]|uniref:uncharacterized protein LOC134817619 n=1 Tax=Bolinopsis microptera TaxID=2820187 RepID=UPI0030791D62